MATESNHTCIIDRTYRRGIMGCACGALWMRPGRDMIRFTLIDDSLLRRLRDYQAAVRHGDAGSMAEAIAAAAARARAERDELREKMRESWPRLQDARLAKWERHIRPIILSRPCAYCGDVATEIDHVIPLTRGGSAGMRNLAAACKRCNGEKGKQTPAEWKTWRLRRGRPWPPPRLAA